MANFLSPGVYWSEVDLTTIVPNLSTTSGALVGNFAWGPVNEIFHVTSQNDLVTYFATPNGENFEDWFTASSFLSYAKSLKLVRAANTRYSLNATAGKQGKLITNHHEFELNYNNFELDPAYGLFAARYPGDLGNSIKVSMFTGSGSQLSYDSWEYKNQFGSVAPDTTTFAKEKNGLHDEMHVIVVDEGGMFTGQPGAVLERWSGLSKASDAMKNDGSPNYYKDVINQSSKYVYIINEPHAMFYNVESVTVETAGSGLFSGNNLSILGGTGQGALANVVVDSAGAVERVDIANSGSGYLESDVLTLTVPSGAGASLRVLTANGASNAAIVNVAIVASGAMYANATGIVLSGGYGEGAIADITVNSHGSIIAVDITTAGEGYSNGDILKVVTSEQPQFTFVFANTGEGGVIWGAKASNTKFEQPQSYYTSTLGGGTVVAPDESDLMKGYDLFANPDDVDVSLVMTSSHSSDVCKYVIDNIVGGSEGSSAGRRDAVAFISPPRNLCGLTNPATAAMDLTEYRNTEFGSSSYAVMDSSWKKLYDKYNSVYRWVPMNGDVAGLCARTDFTNDTWWSPAGFNRGHIKDALAVSWNPNISQRDELYSHGINPIVNFRGEGVVLYGDKTMQVKSSAFDRINVRRLFIILEKTIANAAKYSLFEFNDQFTRAQFVALVEPYLRDVKAKRGIYDFRVVCDETNNTPQVIDSNQFIGDIYIKPARSINFIQLNFVAVATGVSFSTVVGQFG